jgi:hypothetical protein
MNQEEEINRVYTVDAFYKKRRIVASERQKLLLNSRLTSKNDELPLQK